MVYDGGGEQGEMTVQCRDPANGGRLIARFMPCNHADDVASLTAEAADVRDTVHPHLLRLRDVYAYEVQRFVETGMCSELWQARSIIVGGETRRRESWERVVGESSWATAGLPTPAAWVAL
jgi:hypothetical protein